MVDGAVTKVALTNAGTDSVTCQATADSRFRRPGQSIAARLA
jgi:hypothetical protein